MQSQPPGMTSLVGGPLDMLDECSLCRGKSINCSAFLSEQLLSCFVDTNLTTCTVIARPQIAPGALNIPQWLV